MDRNYNLKYNDSCIKLFEFIKMLYDGDVELNAVINMLSEGGHFNKARTHVTLNKYLNAMKIFGIDIKKVNGKYKMLSSLYKFDFDANDIKSINILTNFLDFLSDGKHKNNLKSFLRNLEIRFDENARYLMAEYQGRSGFFPAELLEKVKLCAQYCSAKRKLEIVFESDGEEINLLCSPLEYFYEHNDVYLRVLGNNGSRIYEIPSGKIIRVQQLHSTASRQAIATTVVYKIKNRLAKNYNLRDWEVLEGIDADGCKIIVNKNEDFNQLLHRLMRYGKECEIISPKFIKEEMINMITKTLDNYKT